MKKMTEHQIVAILKEAEAGISVKELCRKYGIGNSTFINGVINTVVWKPPISNV
nr:transposase [Snodgrassella alvi]